MGRPDPDGPMVQKLPSFRDFQPKFYSGGPMRFHLSLLYDLVSQAKPKQVVFLGFGDGDAFFTACQAALEQNIPCQCVAVRRNRAGESADDDPAWRNGRVGGEEFYGESARFFETPAEALAEIADGSVEILMLDDSDSGTRIRKDLSAWQSKLSSSANVLIHGLRLERDDSPAAAWNEWVGNRPQAEFAEGVGLGVAVLDKSGPGSFFVKHSGDLAILYSIVAAQIDASARATTAEKETAAFKIRQVWLDSLLADRREVQRIIEHQARALKDLEGRFQGLLEDRAKAQLVIESLNEQVQHFDNLRRDRAKAQLIMDSQHEQLKH